jgi:hypothetical protein
MMTTFHSNPYCFYYRRKPTFDFNFELIRKCFGGLGTLSIIALVDFYYKFNATCVEGGNQGRPNIH